MRIEVRHPAYATQQLSVETASLLGGPKLLLNGEIVKRQKGRYPVAADSGAEALIQMRYNLVDPIPTLKIDDEPVRLAEPLHWYEYAWGGLPILLVFTGGALGGLVGGIAAVLNGRIFRSDRGAVAMYGLTAVVTLSAAVIFLVLAVAVRSMIGAHR
jgi:hypothetical protein